VARINRKKSMRPREEAMGREHNSPCGG
jgi:hypothetical protein